MKALLFNPSFQMVNPDSVASHLGLLDVDSRDGAPRNSRKEPKLQTEPPGPEVQYLENFQIPDIYSP